MAGVPYRESSTSKLVDTAALQQILGKIPKRLLVDRERIHQGEFVRCFD